jgi:hypothetical protein
VLKLTIKIRFEFGNFQLLIIFRYFERFPISFSSASFLLFLMIFEQTNSALNQNRHWSPKFDQIRWLFCLKKYKKKSCRKAFFILRDIF